MVSTVAAMAFGAGLADHEIVRTDGGIGRRSDGDALPGDAADPRALHVEDGAAALDGDDLPFQLVAEAHEVGDVEMRRRFIELLRRADLPDDAVAQDDDPVGERQGLVLVVRHVDGRRAELVVDAPDLRAHLEAQLRVEVRERLVHQHERRLDDDGAGDRHALLLAAGELARQLVLLAPQADEVQRLVDLAVDLGLGRAAHLQAEADVLAHVEMGKERVVLEHHAEPALLRAQGVDPALVEPDRSAGDGKKTRDAVQRRRLSAARRSEQGDELAAPDGQGNVAQGVERPEIAAHTIEPDFVELGKGYGHRGSLTFDLTCASRRRPARPTCGRRRPSGRAGAAVRSDCRRSTSRIRDGRIP